jgi:hypothetical protein
MRMILLDWMRMGQLFSLANAVACDNGLFSFREPQP